MARLRFVSLLPAFSSAALAAELCTASQSCWPSSDVWSAFNTSIGGRLIAPRPPAWPCHDPNYDEYACNEVKANLENSFWRSNQTGAMENPVWESLDCGIDTPRNATCDQGFVPVYSVTAIDANDVSAAVKFAGKHGLKLVVKNTGHDYLGRSSGEDSFSIWTRNLRGIYFANSFTPAGCFNATGEAAVTLGAAEQWRSVYSAANNHKVTVVGGAANSVGAAGGWLLGGGHSPLGGMYGMGVDNVLQFNIVKPDGDIVAANRCQNKDLFWALRGGGGGTWGVVLDITYKTHPPLNSIVALGVQLDTSSTQQLVEATSVFLQTLPNVTSQGARGYGFWQVPSNSLGFVLIHPNSPSVEATNATLTSLYYWASRSNGTVMSATGSIHRTFFEMFAQYIGDVGIAVPSWMGGRLISSQALLKNSTKLAPVALGDGILTSSINIVGGGVVNDFGPDSAGLNPQWRKDALVSWNIAGGWVADTPSEVIEKTKNTVTKLTLELGKHGGLDDAAYLNEADPAEPNWKNAFFGSHYNRLLEIKGRVDPKGLFTCNRKGLDLAPLPLRDPINPTNLLYDLPGSSTDLFERKVETPHTWAEAALRFGYGYWEPYG